MARRGQEIRMLPVRRLEALVDGVFAIAITLLAIEIGVPTVESARGADLVDALAGQWPSYLAYAVTFFIVGGYWINHHRMFFLLRGVDHGFLMLNIFCLMAIAIIPFPTAVIAEYLTDPELRGAAAGLYALGMLVLAVVFNVAWQYAHRRGLFRPDVDDDLVRAVLRSYAIGPVVFVVALGLAAWAPIVALVLLFLVPVGYLFEGPVAKIDVGFIDPEA